MQTEPLIRRAFDLARRLGNPQAFWLSAGAFLHVVSAPQYAEERLRLAQELAAASQAGVSVGTLGGALWQMVDAFLGFGQRRPAEDMMAELKALAERTNQGSLLMASMSNDAILATLDGRLEEAVVTGRHMLARGDDFGIPVSAAIMQILDVLPAQVHLGNASQALERSLQAGTNAPESLGREMTMLFCLTHLGRYAEVAEMLERLVVARPGIGSAEDETPASLDILALESAALAGHRQAAELLLRQLAGSCARTTGSYFPTCTARHLGAAAALLGHPEEARQYFQEAIKVCTEMRFRPELALTRLQLAELLLKHYLQEKSEAIAHLEFAIAESRDMKMQPSLERALRHKEILKA